MKDEYDKTEVWNIVAGALDKPIGELERLGWDGVVHEEMSNEGILKSYYVEISKSAGGDQYDIHHLSLELFADKN